MKIVKQLNLSDLPDGPIKDNFLMLQEIFDESIWENMVSTRIEYTFDAAITNEKIAHGLGFTPTDILLTYVSPDSGVTVTWNYDEFDRDFIDVTVSAACTIRFIACGYVGDENDNLA